MDPPINPQFAQPSKVIHVRNLPFDVSDDEIRELCRPWGQVVAVKSKVGTNRNQAFVEFAHIQSAMAIVGHYQSGTEAAQVRGRQVHLNYSGRERLTNMAATDLPSPVLYAHIQNVAPELWASITVDLLSTVFGAFAYVYKVVMHPSGEGGMLAWLQFVDAPTAQQVRDALQGQPIPSHLLHNHPQPPSVHLSFSPHTDLRITTQSHSSRDFGNPSLPWGDPDPSLVTHLLPEGEGVSNVLNINFEKATYPVTLDAVHTICSTYGTVQKIHIFERDGKTVALVQYADQQMALSAKHALEGHPMYDGGHNVMRPIYSRHRSLCIRPGDRSRDYTQPLPLTLQPATSAAGSGDGAQQAQQAGGGGWREGGDGGRHAQQVQWQEDFAQQAQQQYDPQPDAGVSGDDYVLAHENVLKLIPTMSSTQAKTPQPFPSHPTTLQQYPLQQQYTQSQQQYASTVQPQHQPQHQPSLRLQPPVLLQQGRTPALAPPLRPPSHIPQPPSAFPAFPPGAARYQPR